MDQNSKNKFDIFKVFFLSFFLSLAFSANLNPVLACSNNSECSGGQVCFTDGTCQACTSDAQCSGGLSCLKGACITSGVLNTSCRSSSDCIGGLECAADKTCQVPAPPTLTPAPLGGDALPATNLDNVTCNTTGSEGCPVGLCKINGLCLPPNQYKNGIASSNSLTDLILKVIQGLVAFAGVIAVVFIIIGGYQYMASGGNEELAEKGKKTISNFVIGLVIIILAYTIVTILSATLTGADKLLQK